MKQFSIKITTCALGLFLTAGAYANLSDDLDKNTTPATLEEREEEAINTSDSFDENITPSSLEEREKQEEVESDLIQSDDPEKTYDPLDDEFDE